MRILAVDPGSSLVGWAVLEDSTLLHAGLLEPVQLEMASFNQRINSILWQVLGDFQDLINTYHITNVAWEIVPSFGQYASRDKIVAVVSGLKTLTFLEGFSWCEQSPVGVKKFVTGNAKAKKEEMKEKALELFPTMGEFKKYDPYDAALIGWSAYQKNQWVYDEGVLSLVGKS